MITKLRELYTRNAAEHPVLKALLWKIYHFKLFGVRRHILGSNNAIVYRNSILAGVVFDIQGSGNRIEIRDGCVLNNVTFYLRGDDHHILIEKSCKFSQAANLWLEDRNCVLEIGEGSTFVNVHLALTEPGSKMTIGRDCMFASDVEVRTGDSHSIILRETNERLNYAQDVSIGEHVWVASHTIILKGSSIPENSVVATGSVVTRPFETGGVIIAGNPARQIREGISWSRRRIPKPDQAA